jgi:hypothetical protein
MQFLRLKKKLKQKRTNMQKCEIKRPKKEKIKKDLDVILDTLDLKKTKNKIGIKNGNLTKRKVKRLKFDKTD